MQKPAFITLMSLAVFELCAMGATGRDKPVKSTTPLTPDEIAIYRAILQQNNPEEPESLNVSLHTYPLDPKSPLSGLSNAECLKGIELQNLTDVTHSFHDLTPDVLAGRNIKLVDPDKQAKIVRNNDPDKAIRKGTSVRTAVQTAFSTALFSLSEIAFDKEHRHAVVSYRLWCGALCGRGYTVVFEKVGDRWQKTDRLCAGWIS
jgi:hypothetical protein